MCQDFRTLWMLQIRLCVFIKHIKSLISQEQTLLHLFLIRKRTCIHLKYDQDVFLTSSILQAFQWCWVFRKVSRHIISWHWMEFYFSLSFVNLLFLFFSSSAPCELSEWSVTDVIRFFFSMAVSLGPWRRRRSRHIPALFLILCRSSFALQHVCHSFVLV